MADVDKIELAAEIAELMQEWRQTCSRMDMRWRDADAAAFIVEGIAHRLPAEPVPPTKIEAAARVMCESLHPTYMLRPCSTCRRGATALDEAGRL